jgi:hypothetical protein
VAEVRWRAVPTLIWLAALGVALGAVLALG